MDHYQQLRRHERIALSVAAGIASASLLSGMLWLFNSVQPGQVWTGLVATPAGLDPSCVAPDLRAPVCKRQVAAAQTASPASVAHDG